MKLKENIICVEWADATSFKGWWDKEELEKESLLKVTSVGIELSRDEQVILIAQSVDIKNGQYRNLQMIPISCVIKDEIIKHGKK